MGVRDITLRGGAVSFAHKRKYDNLKCGLSGLNGFGWQINKLPKTSHLGSFYRTEFASNDSVHFNLSPNAQGIHTASHGFSETLKIDEAAKTFLVTRKNGTVWTFSNDPAGLVPQGLPISVVAENGKATEFVYQNRRLVKVVAKDKAAKTVGTLEYTYNAEGLISALTLRENDGNVRISSLISALWETCRGKTCGGKPAGQILRAQHRRLPCARFRTWTQRQSRGHQAV